MNLYASTSRDVVMTIMHRGDFNYIAPFVLSLKKSGFRGSTVIFASHVDRTTIEQLHDCGVVVVPFRFSGKRCRQHLSRPWPLWRWFFSTRAPRSSKIWLAHAVFHLFYRRHILYLEFLEKHAADFNRVLTADAKDVFFQDDPFAWNWTPGLHFFLEEGHHRLGECRVHREWFRRQFGPAFIEPHVHRVPACAGTTFGDMASMRQYLNLMIATTMKTLELGKLWGGDQGIHNYILINKLMNNITVHDNRHGPVLTMSVMDESEFEFDAQGALLNDDHVVVPVLHQYDHFPALTARLMKSLENAAPIAVSDTVLAVPVVRTVPTARAARAVPTARAVPAVPTVPAVPKAPAGTVIAPSLVKSATRLSS